MLVLWYGRRNLVILARAERSLVSEAVVVVVVLAQAEALWAPVGFVVYLSAAHLRQLRGASPSWRGFAE